MGGGEGVGVRDGAVEPGLVPTVGVAVGTGGGELPSSPSQAAKTSDRTSERTNAALRRPSWIRLRAVLAPGFPALSLVSSFMASPVSAFVGVFSSVPGFALAPRFRTPAPVGLLRVSRFPPLLPSQERKTKSVCLSSNFILCYERSVSRARSIGEVFYETRVLMGRGYTLKRFAREVLEDAVDPVMLGYIEKGQRFPTEALVRRLAAVRREDPRPLLALLWRDRMLRAFGRELGRVLAAGSEIAGVEEAELAVLVTHGLSLLPDDGSPVSLRGWRRSLRQSVDRRSRRKPPTESAFRKAEEILRAKGLVEVRGDKIRRRGRHYVARTAAERRSLAIEFCAIFLKGLLDKLALEGFDRGTYLRNHFLTIDPSRLAEFEERLDAAVRRLVEEFSEEGAGKRFVNVLVTATPWE
ncbi:MAG: hypothetical protein KatS3mg076_2458 [Candidatus Binatia bacterium]|nr:MAG: hypothetical protein KatS3mg076_2458 [Candidatus Binatia bacterium]